MPTPAEMDTLIAKQAIAELCYRYARGSDRLDAKCFASAFWEDGIFNEPQGDGPFSDTARSIADTMDQHFALTHHLNGNILIDFADEDHANTEVYFRAFHLTKPGVKSEELAFLVGERRLAELDHAEGDVYDIVVGGRYLDQVERRQGVWKIKHRRLIFDYSTVQKSQALRPDEGINNQSAARMTRDRHDPSYATSA